MPDGIFYDAVRTSVRFRLGEEGFEEAV